MVANVGAQTRPVRKTQQFSRRNVDTFSIIPYRGVKTTFRGVPFATALPNAQHTAHTYTCMHARARTRYGRQEREYIYRNPHTPRSIRIGYCKYIYLPKQR